MLILFSDSIGIGSSNVVNEEGDSDNMTAVRGKQLSDSRGRLSKRSPFKF